MKKSKLKITVKVPFPVIPMKEETILVPDNEKGGALMVEMRKRYNVKQRRIAEIMGIPQSFVCALEKGTRSLTAKNWKRYFDALQKAAQELQA